MVGHCRPFFTLLRCGPSSLKITTAGRLVNGVFCWFSTSCNCDRSVAFCLLKISVHMAFSGIAALAESDMPCGSTVIVDLTTCACFFENQFRTSHSHVVSTGRLILMCIRMMMSLFIVRSSYSCALRAALKMLANRSVLTSSWTRILICVKLFLIQRDSRFDF